MAEADTQQVSGKPREAAMDQAPVPCVFRRPGGTLSVLWSARDKTLQGISLRR